MEDIWIPLSPVYQISRVFGHATYNTRGDIKNRKLYSSNALKVYSFVILIFFGISTYLLQILYTETKIQKVLTVHIFISINNILNISASFQNILREKNIILCIQKLIFIDKNIKALGLFPDYRKERLLVVLLIALQYSLIVLYYIAVWLVNPFYESIFTYFFLFLKKSISVIVLLQVEIWMMLIRNRLNLLKNNLVYSARNICSPTILRKVFSKTARLHEELCCVIRILNKFYSKSMLISTIMTVSYTIMIGYEITLNVANTRKIASYSTSIATHILFFVIAVYYCSQVTNAVSMTAKKRSDLQNKNILFILFTKILLPKIYPHKVFVHC